MIRILPGVLVLLLLASSAPAYHAVVKNASATLELSCANQRDALALSDLLTVSLTIEGDQPIQVEPWTPLAKNAEWTLFDRSAVRVSMTPTGKHRWEQTLLLAPMQPGDSVPLEVLSPRWKLGDGDWRTDVWPRRTIQVTTSIRSPDLAGMRDGTSIEELPPATGSQAWRWLWVSVLPIVIFVIWWRGRRTRMLAPDPYVAAQQALDRLARRSLLQPRHRERFVTMLTLVLRGYLERRCGIPARRLTSTELIEALGRDPSLASHAEPLKGLLVRCDLVKYAHLATTADTCAQLATEVRQLIAAIEATMAAPPTTAQNS